MHLSGNVQKKACNVEVKGNGLKAAVRFSPGLLLVRQAVSTAEVH